MTGVFIRIAVEGYPCTTGEDRIEAQRVAAHLKIAFQEVDLSREYKKRVFEVSVREFKKGRTPNPDALCNREIKFGIFFDWCRAQGAQFVATGHYARLKTEQGRTLLLQGADGEKDQSYFLWAVPEEKLSRTLFPIGHLHKSGVRALARKFRLPNAARKDSQGLCFLGPIMIEDMLERELELTPGEVLDESGAVVGVHRGVPLYTVGQRHGFSLFVHSPKSAPHYVTAKDAEFNTITVSTKRAPDRVQKEIVLSETNWIGPVEDGRYQARFRYRQRLIPADLKTVLRRGDTERYSVVLLEPQYVPEGQSMVLYAGERCMGGGIV